MVNKEKNGLSEKNWIVKSNTLNEIRNTQMTISQIRLFTVYLSKINPKDVTTRQVSFKLEDYTKIMQFKQTNTSRLEESAKELLRIIITFKKEKQQGDKYREFVACQLFKRFKLEKNELGEWIVNIDCHDDVLSLMFELQKHFFKYQLWNSLQLTSPNQVRMYELLKQYEYAGAREINLNDLREFLGIKPNEYPQWERFRIRVLEASQKALEKHTDIRFTWEAIRGRGKGGKITGIRFNIEKNVGSVHQLTFDECMSKQYVTEIDRSIEEFEHSSKDIYSFLSEACNDEFILEEIAVLHSLIVKIIPYTTIQPYELDLYDYIQEKYNELNWRATQKPIQNRFAYLKKIIESEVKQ